MSGGFGLGSWLGGGDAGAGAGGALDGGAPPAVVPATRDGAIFDEWAIDRFSAFDDARDGVAPECRWWNGTVQYESLLCSHFALSRVAAGTVERAVDRATRCAAAFETECVLAPEIGLSVPAAFVYDETTTSMAMVIAPRLLPHRGVSVRLRVQDPSGAEPPRAVALNRTVRVEYLPGGKRAPTTTVFANASAWCVQLLRAAFAPSCWDALD